MGGSGQELEHIGGLEFAAVCNAVRRIFTFVAPSNLGHQRVGRPGHAGS